MITLEQLLIEEEGFRAQPYLDSAGVWTIGCGTTRINGQPVTSLTPACTQEEAVSFLTTDLTWVYNVILHNVKVPLTRNQRTALGSLIYNIGGPNFCSSSVLRCLNLSNYQMAATHILDWNRAHVDGQLVSVQGLTNRRYREYNLFNTPDTPEVPEAPLSGPAVNSAQV